MPKGGWVTHAQQKTPDIRTTVITHESNVNKVVVVHQYGERYWGSGWYSHPRGFFYGDSFWSGYMWGSLLNSHNYATQPVYVMSPASQVQVGALQPPAQGFTSEQQVQQSVLDTMAKGDPSGTDAKAGLYVATDKFDPANPGDKISGEFAYNTLSHGGSIYFHPPNGAFEKISDFNDLQSYLYSKEARTQAPQQEEVHSQSHPVRNLLIGTAVVGGVAAGGYWLYKKSRDDDW